MKPATITIHGKEMTVFEFAKANNLSPSTIYGRMASGWTPEQLAITPVKNSQKGKPSKGEAERELNETEFGKLPDKFRKIIRKRNYEGTNFGVFIRESHRKEFDFWYEEVFCKRT